METHVISAFQTTIRIPKKAYITDIAFEAILVSIVERNSLIITLKLTLMMGLAIKPKSSTYQAWIVKSLMKFITFILGEVMREDRESGNDDSKGRALSKRLVLPELLLINLTLKLKPTRTLKLKGDKFHQVKTYFSL